MSKINTFVADCADSLSKLNIPEILLPFRVRVMWLDCVDKAGVERIYKGDHLHSFYEMHFVLSGNVKYLINGYDIDIFAGEFLMVKLGLSHCHCACSDDILRLSLAFETDDELFCSILQTINESKKAKADINSLTAKIFEYASQPNVYTASLVSGYVNEIMYCSLKALGVPFEPIGDKHLDPRVKVATEYIYRNVNKMIKSEDVAKECYLSVKQLGRVFASEMGTSLSEYIKLTRFNYAKSLLVTTELSIKEIAFYMGFDSQSSFTTFFKHRSGMSPGAFRNTK